MSTSLSKQKQDKRWWELQKQNSRQTKNGNFLMQREIGAWGIILLSQSFPDILTEIAGEHWQNKLLLAHKSCL